MGMHIALITYTVYYLVPGRDVWEGNIVYVISAVQYACPYKEGNNIKNHPVLTSR